jgi:mannose-1-phosphate guanylyltransferase/mannose-6-phosphate isomerase
MITPVLLCGGVGSRLWPISRELYPKQFLSLTGGRTMLQETLIRTSDLPAASPIVVCNDEHRFVVAEQMRQIGIDPAAILLEPFGCNTAPALALAALDEIKRNSDAILLVLPADHIITKKNAFAAAVSKAIPLAQEGRLVTFGIVPTHPETGYGYIRCGKLLEEGSYVVKSFVEKPNHSTAQSYVESKQYLWNSGIFLVRATTYLDELEKYSPNILSACRAASASSSSDMDFIRPDADAFKECPSDSIDYAVMEHTESGVVVSLDCGWNDLGAWSSLFEIENRDELGNICRGDVLLDNSTNSYVRSESRLVAATGVDNLIIVETSDAVLVADRDGVQGVKRLVSHLKENGRKEAIQHARTYRPWGSYETLVCSDRFQVKRIVVQPGQALSLQMHHHRAEHWVVVKGTAEVTCGDDFYILGEDESTYIPLGSRHRLANPGQIPLEVIEVQSGSYLGEDDIVRFDDVYGRSIKGT